MKRALVLSGGGGLGAYQVGALRYIAEVRKDLYDAVYGVSVGAVNGAKLVLYPNTELSAAVADLQRMWLNLSTKGVYKRHFPFGMIHAAWNGTNVFNSKPIHDLIKREFDPTKVAGNGYEFGVGTASWNTGKYKVVPHTDPSIVDYIYASSVFPMAFKPIKLDGEWWIDGGVRNAVPLKVALEAGAETVDMILTEPAAMEPIEGDPQDILQYGPRILGIMAHEIFTTDFCEVVENTDATVNLVRPSVSLNADPLNFDKLQTVRLMDRGYEDAEQQLGAVA